MSENIAITLLAGAISLLTGLVIFGLQFLSEKSKRSADFQREIYKDKLQCYESLSSLMARRIYRMRRLYYACRPTTTVSKEEAISDYKEIVFEWNDSIVPLLAKTEIYFGKGIREKFENDVMRQFVKIGSEGERLIRSSPSSDDMKAYWTNMDQLNSLSYQFDKTVGSLILLSNKLK